MMQRERGRESPAAEAKASIKGIKFPLKSFFLSLGFSRSVFEQRVCVSAAYILFERSDEIMRKSERDFKNISTSVCVNG